MNEEGRNEAQSVTQTIKKPTSVIVFGVLNIVIGIYQLIRIFPGLYRTITSVYKEMGRGTSSEILFLLLIIVGIGLSVWLIVLGTGLLKMKRWSRRGSIMYARIQIVFMIITLGAIFISSIIDWQNFPRVIRASVNIDNGLALIQWIYMILLLIFMKTAKVKEAFEVMEK